MEEKENVNWKRIKSKRMRGKKEVKESKYEERARIGNRKSEEEKNDKKERAIKSKWNNEWKTVKSERMWSERGTSKGIWRVRGVK